MHARKVRQAATAVFASLSAIVGIVPIACGAPAECLAGTSAASLFLICMAPSFGRSFAYNQRAEAFLDKVMRMGAEEFSSPGNMERMAKYARGDVPEEDQD